MIDIGNIYLFDKNTKRMLFEYNKHEAATGDIIILFSPDGNSIAEKIPPLIEKMKVGEIPRDEPRRVGRERKMKPFQCSLGMLIQLFREFISGIQARHRTCRVPRHNFRAA